MTGPHVRHAEWQARTDGSAQFAGDLQPPDLLIGAILRSPYASARIVDIDTNTAEASSGVHAVVTAADLPDRRYTDYGTPDRPAIARETVRYFGHEVAAVAAETEWQATMALDRIRVHYKALPPQTTLEEAAGSGSELVPTRRDSIACSLERAFGDTESARNRTAHTVSGRYRFGSQAHACMEPHTTLAQWIPEQKRLHVWTPTQGPRTVQRELAAMLGVGRDQVRIHSIAAGGDFGSRVRPGDIEVLAGALAIKSGRPVRLSLSRADEFAHTKRRHDFVIDLTSTADPQGRLLSRDACVIAESGGFAQAGGNELNYCSLVLGSQYQLTAAHISGAAIYTNRRPGGAFRGAGGPQAVFAIESQLDELAAQLNVDPVDLRIWNANQSGNTTITGWQIESARLIECLQTARDQIDWDAKQTLGGTGRGVGIAAAIHVSGSLSTSHVTSSESTIDLTTDGSVRVRTGAGDPGTGQSMVAGILVADELGLTPSDVEIVYEDTAETPYDPGAGASKGTYMTGNAAVGAGKAAAERLRELAADKFTTSKEAIGLTNGQVLAGDDSVSISDLVAIAPETVDGQLSIDHQHTVDLPLANKPSGVGNLSPTYAFAAHAVEVEVDRSTGEVKILEVVPVHDSGTIINQTAARGQVVGGVVMGLGAALGEELLYTEGRLANGSYTEYALPRAGNVPDIAPTFLESNTGPGPHGAKGLAEIALSPTPAAVANAIAHATGVRIRDLPITPDKILNPLTSQQCVPVGRDIRPHTSPRRIWVSAVRWAYPRGLHALLHRIGTRLARKPQASQPITLRKPSTEAEASTTLSDEPNARPLAGGTDLLVARKEGLRPESVLVDLTGIPELTELTSTPTGDLVLGAAATLGEVVEFAAAEGDDVVVSTIDTIASPQIRSMATVAGNLCQEKRCGYFRNGFPCYKRGGVTCPCYAVLGEHRFYHAALGAHRCQATTPSDLATTLTALDAVVHVRGPSGTRSMPMSELYRGPGETVLSHAEAITHLDIPAPARHRKSVFEKIRPYDGGFALVSACVSIQCEDNVVTDCRAVLGGIAPTPYRCLNTERMLLGNRITHDLIDRVSRAWHTEAHPLPGNKWKLEAASGLLVRAFHKALQPGAAE